MFELCRRVDWLDFDAFADFYVEFTLAQRRAEAAARLFGYARGAERRAWGSLPSPARKKALHRQLTALFETVLLKTLFKQGATLDPDVLDAHCRSRMAAYKVPRAYQIVADLPKTSTGKILRRMLRSLDA